ncbi:MAG: nucleoside-triphosphatase [Chloroflexota bacterium]|nr:nucleoside-triphosphatase [Chloroflexota bacterium]
MKNVLLTGRPGVGKTRVIMRALEMTPGVKATGFYTRELRGPKGRLGFEAVTLDGKCRTLAHVDFKGPCRVSKYGVDVAGFEEGIVPSVDSALHPDAQLIVIDEIGKMECFSPKFRETVVSALDSGVPVLGTIGLRGNAFIQSLKRREDVEIVEVTRTNRDRLPEGLARMLDKCLA